MGSSEASLWNFNSPLIYLFGGIFAILALITSALIILVCCQRKRRFDGDGNEDIERGDGDQKTVTAAYNGGDCADSRPKLVVIMAGDEVPTYLATPSNVVTADTYVS
ncbi:protein GLUTAMINE DUMPER 2-like [Bidens hawaiensis]|uniref:protein GLUTAMINE DUMPER 2-like n=1 Tax=Bidens hawaiensis TaxID=980011 RepID=UPI004049BEEF